MECSYSHYLWKYPTFLQYVSGLNQFFAALRSVWLMGYQSPHMKQEPCALPFQKYSNSWTRLSLILPGYIRTRFLFVSFYHLFRILLIKVANVYLWFLSIKLDFHCHASSSFLNFLHTNYYFFFSVFHLFDFVA